MLSTPCFMAEVKRYEGTVKWFNGQKGFGFIDPEDDSGSDLFVHQSEIKAEGFRFLRDGQRVEFSVDSGEDGRKKAVEVVALGRTRGFQPGPRRGGRGRRGGFGRYRGEYGGRFGGGGRGDGGGDDGEVSGPQCYNCGRFGHFARNCYQGNDNGGGGGGDQGYENGRGRGRGRGGHSRGGGRGGRSGTCYRCGEEGHFARECPNEQE